MTITHHPDASTLMGFAAGTLPEALSAVVSSHAVLCPDCRKSLKVMNSLGGAALAKIGGAPLARPMADVTAAADGRRSVPAGDAQAVRAPQREVTELVNQVLNGDYSGIRWRRLGFGIWHVPLPLSSDTSGDLRLFRVAPGVTIPDHGHNGAELSLILSGSYSDKAGTFGAGDLADMDEQDDHMPVACPETGCVCLIASERPARYKGLFARIMQPFVGL